MPGTSLEFDLGTIVDHLSWLQSRFNDLTPLMRNLGAMLTTSSKQRFETKIAPDGVKWPALAARTVRHRIRYKYSPHDILLRRGDLLRSINYRASSGQVIVSLGGAGNSTAYARAHQLGANINRVGAKVGGYTITLPARPVLGLSREDELAIIGEADNFLAPEID